MSFFLQPFANAIRVNRRHFQSVLSPPIERKGKGLSLRIPIRASSSGEAVVVELAAICVVVVDLAGDGDANARATAPPPLRARPPRAKPWSMPVVLRDALLQLLLLLGQEAATAGGERIV